MLDIRCSSFLLFVDVPRFQRRGVFFHGGDKVLAADLLGITARTIYRREAEWRDEDLIDD